jgi:hypothetical protein
MTRLIRAILPTSPLVALRAAHEAARAVVVAAVVARGAK